MYNATIANTDTEPVPTPHHVSFVDTSKSSDGFSVGFSPKPTPSTTPAVAGTSAAVPAPKPSVNSYTQEHSTPTPVPEKKVAAADVITLVNDERQKHGVGKLAANSLLMQAAQISSDDHVKYAYAGHVSPNGRQPFSSEKQLGYSYASIGENLAYMTPGSGAAAIVAAWMKSESHRDTLLSPDFLEAGVGITDGPVTIDGGTYSYVVSMHFGRQL